MKWHGVVEWIGRHRYLALATVFAVMGGQEIVEILVLEQPAGPGAPSPWGVSLHLAQLLAIVVGTYVFVDAYREKSALAERERRRAGELAAALEALRENEQVLATTMERLTLVQEEERRLVAYEVHDSLAQVIVSAKQHLDTFADRCRCRSPRVRAELRMALDRLDRAILETRRLLAALGPGILDSLGLVPALRALVDESARQAGWDAGLVDELGDERLPSTVETAAYRIAQEALTNARKHARATRVTLAIRRETTGLVIEIRDWGLGFTHSPGPVRARGLGLVSMRERARLLGGQCCIESIPGEGTAVRATLPVAIGALHASAG